MTNFRKWIYKFNFFHFRPASGHCASTSHRFWPESSPDLGLSSLRRLKASVVPFWARQRHWLTHTAGERLGSAPSLEWNLAGCTIVVLVVLGSSQRPTRTQKRKSRAQVLPRESTRTISRLRSLAERERGTECSSRASGCWLQNAELLQDGVEVATHASRQTKGTHRRIRAFGRQGW